MPPQLFNSSPHDNGIFVGNQVEPADKPSVSTASPLDEEYGRDIEQGQHSQVPEETTCSHAKKRCTRGRLLTWGTIIVIIIGGVLAVLMTLAGKEGVGSFFVPTDPPGIKKAVPWGIVTRDGLVLKVVNSLDEFWVPYFDLSLAEWDNDGVPDVLTLIPERGPVDPDCTPIRGRLKLCNGDYGNTDWQGLNINLISNDQIVQAVSKMNDYHIRDKDTDARRQYTMCHEIGHGLGLAHTDENYYNSDRGDCMDYTTRPHNNLRPGKFNFQVLNKMYGPQEEIGETPQIPPTPPVRPDKEENKNKDKNKDDRLLGDAIDNVPIPESVLAQYEEAVAELEYANCYDIERDQKGKKDGKIVDQVCERDLGEGYRIEVHQLPVP